MLRFRYAAAYAMPPCHAAIRCRLLLLIIATPLRCHGTRGAIAYAMLRAWPPRYDYVY